MKLLSQIINGKYFMTSYYVEHNDKTKIINFEKEFSTHNPFSLSGRQHVCYKT